MKFKKENMSLNTTIKNLTNIYAFNKKIKLVFENYDILFPTVMNFKCS